MSERCYKCFRPKPHCLCKYAKPIVSGVKFVLLMHPKEAKRERTGTGRLAHICLSESEIFVGLDFSENEYFQNLLASPLYFPVLLYPGENAWKANSNELSHSLRQNTAKQKTLLVLVIDATWFCAKKIIAVNLFLLNLPRLSFSGDYRSEFTFKREPRPECLSTIESCYYLIKELQDSKLISGNVDPLPLMTIFRAMVAFQIQAQNDRLDGKLPNTHAYNWKYT
ncbi:MAG: DTW domain-containing protein, partial [Treponema sp.]|nr:DTW domain-containing protein [Treponema sp.]